METLPGQCYHCITVSSFFCPFFGARGPSSPVHPTARASCPRPKSRPPRAVSFAKMELHGTGVRHVLKVAGGNRVLAMFPRSPAGDRSGANGGGQHLLFGHLGQHLDSRCSAEKSSRVAGSLVMGDHPPDVWLQGNLIATMLDFEIRDATGFDSLSSAPLTGNRFQTNSAKMPVTSITADPRSGIEWLRRCGRW